MIIFISGSINSGKSTVAKILAQKIKKCALIEGDSLREMISWVPIEQAIPISLENAVGIIKNFHNRGIITLMVYPLSKINYEYMVDSLKEIDTNKLFFTLSPDIDVVLNNRGNRELKEYEKERIKYHYDVGINNPDFGEIINNSKQTAEETADVVYSKIAL